MDIAIIGSDNVGKALAAGQAFAKVKRVCERLPLTRNRCVDFGRCSTAI
jgi:hypothetical protein